MSSIARRTGWYTLSSLGVPLLGLATLPVFTTRLGPEQFGAFALGSSLAGVASAAATAIAALNLPTELPRLAAEARPAFFGAVVFSAFVAATIASLVVFGAYGVLSKFFALELLSTRATALAIAGGLLNSVWAACVEILTIEGRARSYAATTLVQALVNAGVVALALFVFGQNDDALFWGFGAAAAVGVVGAVRALAGQITGRHARRWLPVVGRGGVTACFASASESGKVAVERAYLGLLVGAVPLGLWAHAQYYKNAAMVALNAISRGALPVAIQEAQEPAPRFAVTLAVWPWVQAFALAAALGFALLGREVIGLLTHGKFVAATPFAVALMLVLLLQTAAKPESVLLVARGHAKRNAELTVFSSAVALVVLFAAAPFCGVWGAVIALYAQMLVYRVTVVAAARRLAPVPFSDQWVVAGTVLVAAVVALDLWLAPAWPWRAAALCVLYALMLYRLWPSLRLMRGRTPAVAPDAPNLSP